MSLRCVGSPAVCREAFLSREGAHILTPVGAVKQVAAETVPGLPLVLVKHRNCAVRLGAAGVHTVLPGVHPVRRQQEGGSLLDGVLGPDDAIPRGTEVAHAGVHHFTCPVGLVLLQLFAEFLQELLHPGYFGFQVRYRRRSSVDAAKGEQQQQPYTGEQQPGMLKQSHVVDHTVRRRLPLPPAGLPLMKLLPGTDGLPTLNISLLISFNATARLNNQL